MRTILLIAMLALAGCDDDCDEDALMDAIKRDIGEKIRSPASAVFDKNPVITKREQICSISVESYVDSQNAFGAVVKSDFSADATLAGSGQIVVATRLISR